MFNYSGFDWFMIKYFRNPWLIGLSILLLVLIVLSALGSYNDPQLSFIPIFMMCVICLFLALVAPLIGIWFQLLLEVTDINFIMISMIIASLVAFVCGIGFRSKLLGKSLIIGGILLWFYVSIAYCLIPFFEIAASA